MKNFILCLSLWAILSWINPLLGSAFLGCVIFVSIWVFVVLNPNDEMARKNKKKKNKQKGKGNGKKKYNDLRSLVGDVTSPKEKVLITYRNERTKKTDDKHEPENTEVSEAQTETV